MIFLRMSQDYWRVPKLCSFSVTSLGLSLEAKEALLSANWIGPSTSSHLSFSRLVKVGGVDRRAEYGLRLHVAVAVAVAAGDESLSLRGCGGGGFVLRRVVVGSLNTFRRRTRQ